MSPILVAESAKPVVVAQRRSRTGYILLFPGLTWLAIFFAIPFVTLFMTSLQQPVPGKLGKYQAGFELSNYANAMAEYWPQFLRSFIYAGIATLLALVIAYPLAYFIAMKGAGGGRCYWCWLSRHPSRHSCCAPMPGAPSWLMRVRSPRFQRAAPTAR